MWWPSYTKDRREQDALSCTLQRACEKPFVNVQVMVSAHRACPFGAVSSVHSLEIIGALLCKIARRVLNMAIFRYVDDFFGPER